MFSISEKTLDVGMLKQSLENPKAGGCVVFEGWVRNMNEGRAVNSLEYEAFDALAEKEGGRIIIEALENFDVLAIRCVHRVGHLAIGDLAVWLGVTAIHREEAFEACKHVIDEVKHRVPIWKKEHYADGEATWVRCERCGHSH